MAKAATSAELDGTGGPLKLIDSYHCKYCSGTGKYIFYDWGHRVDYFCRYCRGKGVIEIWEPVYLGEEERG